MTLKKTFSLVRKFAKQVQPKKFWKEYSEEEFDLFIIGWCIGSGLDEAEAAQFAHHLRYNSGLGYKTPWPPKSKCFPIPLNDAMKCVVKQWSEGHLWGTQEAVELNLQTFARCILKRHNWKI